MIRAVEGNGRDILAPVDIADEDGIEDLKLGSDTQSPDVGIASAAVLQHDQEIAAVERGIDELGSVAQDLDPLWVKDLAVRGHARGKDRAVRRVEPKIVPKNIILAARLDDRGEVLVIGIDRDREIKVRYKEQ